MEKKTIKDLVLSCEGNFNSMNPDKVQFKQECIFALQALSSSYLSDIAEKNPASLQMAIYNIASTNVSLSPIKKEAYLVPRIVNKKPTVCLDISYRGLVSLAIDSGGIVVVQAEIVFEKDNFKYLGKFKEPQHELDPFSNNRGKKVGCYAMAKLKDGTILCEAMSIDEVFKIRDKSEMYKRSKSGPWVEFESEMIKKTVIKRASKLWPKMSENFKTAIDVLNQHEGIENEDQKQDNEANYASSVEKYKVIDEIKNRFELITSKQKIEGIKQKSEYFRQMFGNANRYGDLMTWELNNLKIKLNDMDNIIKGETKND